MYEKSISWECFPGNVEVLIDDSVFVSNGTFTRRIAAENEKLRIYTQAVDKIWANRAQDAPPSLDKQETKDFIAEVLENCPAPRTYDDAKFDEAYAAEDVNKNGRIEQNEMPMLIKKLLE